MDLRPKTSPFCDQSVEKESKAVEVRQVVELPEMVPEVTQYQIHTHKCSKCGRRVGANVPKAEAARKEVLHSKGIYADETGWRMGKKRCWMWVGVTKKATR